MSNSVLQLDNVYRRYHQAERVIEVLSGASLSLYPGHHRPCWPLGAGKTTLLNMAGMLERPDDGEVYIQKVTTSGLSGAAAHQITRPAYRICVSVSPPVSRIYALKILLSRK